MYCLEDTIADAIECKSQNEAYEYIIRHINTYGQPKDVKLDMERKKGYVKNIIEKDIFPHVGKTIRNKIFFLGYMVNNLLKCYLGYRDFDDRDSYTNKRIELPGILLANLFRQYFSKLVKDGRNSIMKELGSCHNKINIMNIINETNIYKLFKSSTIGVGLRYALATGNWGLKITIRLV